MAAATSEKDGGMLSELLGGEGGVRYGHSRVRSGDLVIWTQMVV